MGSFGDQPLKRRYTYKATMAGTTLDILEGTHKHTYNLPGYGGSIPCSLRLARQRDQAEKLHPHLPVSRKTNFRRFAHATPNKHTCSSVGFNFRKDPLNSVLISLPISPFLSRQRMDLLLTYHNNLPGYTGYSPVYSLEGAKPRNCGANPKTTTGAGVLGLML